MPPTAGTDPLVGLTLDGRYRLDAHLAHGGMASVYSAHDLRLDRAVAVKILHPHLGQDAAFAARFIAEAKQAARINHPNVVAVHDQGMDSGRAFIVMELVRGHSVRALLRSVGRLSAQQALALLAPVSAGLAAAHLAGVVHRDIKPENILISEDGRVKVTDFGLARAADDAGPGLTGVGALAGTAGYISPEYVEGQPTDQRSDVYALGIVLFELLTGKVPYTGDNPVQVALAHSRGRVPMPSSSQSDVPPEVDSLVLRATAPDPADRHPDAGAVHGDIRAIRAHLPAPEPLPRPRPGAEDRTPDPGSATHVHPTATRVMPASTVRPGRAGRQRREPKRPTRLRRRLLGALLTAALAGAGVYAWQTFSPVPVPDVRGATAQSATQTLRAAGFTNVRIARDYSADVRADAVIDTAPAAGERRSRSASITVLVSRGAQRTSVPRLTGLTVPQARSQLTARGLLTQAKPAVFDERVPAGSVISSTPGQGARVDVGSTVTVVVSKGPAPVKVADVRRQDAGAAASLLTASGLKVSRATAFSDTVPAGRVIATKPAAGAQMPRGSTVSLVVSRGPKRVEVPNLRMVAERKAVATLRGLGLKVRVVYPAGRNFNKVVGQSVKAGTKVPRGTLITLTVV
ncbi:MAG: Stk1 family PASTA domain-containing Ser/Thr kinase [Actinomycetales bacterium]|nr:Stk1 family PASTA domain-containing Ser/Thr kinase [Actinomycetales bacterium]